MIAVSIPLENSNTGTGYVALFGTVLICVNLG